MDYNSALAPSNYYLELGKLCYYTYTKDIPLPKSYYIVASNDIGPTLQTIVIENEIPEIDYSNVNLIHFTKNANTGRYGFLIDVMD